MAEREKKIEQFCCSISFVSTSSVNGAEMVRLKETV
jgi:hypothetical protein